MKCSVLIPLSLLLASPLLCGQSRETFYTFADRPPATRLEKTIHRLMPSLVKVHGASGLKTIESYATGIVVSEQGHVLTLDQILIQKESTKVVLHDGTVCNVEAYSPHEGLGVRMLKIDPVELAKLTTPLVPLRPASKQDHRNGTFVMSIGNCFRLAEFSEKLSVTMGVVVSRARTGLRYRLQDVDYGDELIITDAPNNPGHYGGGLFTIEGEWIGMNAKIVESTETNSQVSAAIPTGDLVAYIERCVTGGAAAAVEPESESEVVPVEHGIVLFDHGRRVSPPAYVERVVPGSPGREAGLRPDDLIVKIDVHTVQTCKDFHRVLEKYRPGDTVKLTFKRGRSIRQADLKFGEVK